MEDNASEAGKDYLQKILPKVFSIGWINGIPPIITYNNEDKCFTINMKLLQNNQRDINGRLFQTIEDIIFKVRFVASSIRSFNQYGFKHNDYRMLIPKDVLESKCQLILTCYEVDRWYPQRGLRGVLPVRSEHSEITLPTLIDLVYMVSINRMGDKLITCSRGCLALGIQRYMANFWSSIVAFEEDIHLGCNVGAAMIKAFEKFNKEIENGRGTPTWAKIQNSQCTKRSATIT